MDPANPKFAIHEAAREGRTSVVESLLNANPKLASLTDDDGRLPIHWACAYNHPELITLLTSLPTFDPDTPDGSGWTTLMIASSLPQSGGESTISLLLSKGSNPNTTSNSGQTALHFASSKDNLDICRTLLSHNPPASARIKDKRGQLAVHRAAALGSVPILKLLLANKSPVNATDVDGLTALHHAVSEGHGDAALELLRAGAETDKRDGEGRLAIDMAPDSKVRKFLIQAAEREGMDF